MANGRRRHDWDQTACMMALTANCHRDPKKTRAFTWQQFHPLEERRFGGRGIKITSANIRLLKAAFVKGGDDGQ